MKRIGAIQIQHIEDLSASISHFGEYTDDKDAGKFVIKRKNATHTQYKYFHATRADNRRDALADYRRAEGYNNGDWSFIGIRAVAYILVGDKVTQTVKLMSPGLWCIETDSDETFIAETGEEQIDELADLLAEFSFTPEEIAEARKDVQIVKARDVAIADQFSMRG